MAKNKNGVTLKQKGERIVALFKFWKLNIEIFPTLMIQMICNLHFFSFLNYKFCVNVDENDQKSSYWLTMHEFYTENYRF